MPVLRLMKRLLRTEGGVSLIELAIAMFVSALMASLMLSWIFSIAAVDDLHLADDQAVQDLRLAKDEITRELRRATAVLAAETNSFTIWIDGDHDEVQLPEELVTWEIDPGGELIRTLGDGSSVVRLFSLSTADSGFVYDDVSLAAIRSVEITLTVLVDAPRGEDGVRSLTTEISLRGVS